MKNKKKTIIVAIIITLLTCMVLPVAILACKIIVAKQSDGYTEFCEIASKYDERGYVKGFDPNEIDISWYEEVVAMTDKEFFYWLCDNLWKNDELTAEQIAISCFRSPRVPSNEWNSTKIHSLERAELALKYSTEEDLRMYNEENGTSFESAEAVGWASFSENRMLRIYAVMLQNKTIVEFAKNNGLSVYDPIIDDCIYNVFANYFRCEVSLYQFYDLMESEYLDVADNAVDRLILEYWCTHEWRNMITARILWANAATEIEIDLPPRY